MIKVLPSEISGTVKINPSKSITQRAYAIASLCKEKSVIKNPSKSDDSLSSLNIVKRMGSTVEVFKDRVEITGLQKEIEDKFDCGEAGLCIRMFTPILALFGKEVEITGRGSLLKRPVNMMEQPLREMGTIVETNNGFPPIKLNGKLKGGVVEVDAGLTSQFLTGLLIALPNTEEKSRVIAKNTVSRPYIDLTIELLKKAGAKVLNENYSVFEIEPAKFKPLNLEVEGDFSSACFMLVAGVLAGEVTVSNLSPSSKQADKKILDILIQAGCGVKISEKGITVEQSDIKSFSIDVRDCPDIVPSLVPLAAKGNSPSKIFGVSRLKYKESDRLNAMMKEFEKIGVKSEIKEDCLKIFPSKIEGGRANSNNDHRLAMALAVCGLVSEKGVEIENHACISKSYPEFFNHLKAVKGKVITEGEK